MGVPFALIKDDKILLVARYYEDLEVIGNIYDNPNLLDERN